MAALQHPAERRRENFPVASLLLPSFARPQILAFYDFARGADDIADHATMAAEDKIRVLQKIQHAFETHQTTTLPPWAADCYRMVQSGRMRRGHGEKLLLAFLQDAKKNRYDTIDELLAYCMLSANPVGRMVLEACREPSADLEASDALCTALQLINHMQDIHQDYRVLNRIYLPQEWLKSSGLPEATLGADHCSDGLRGVIDRVLDVCDQKLQVAARLPRSIKRYGVRREVAFIMVLAKHLVRRLRRQDPLAGRVSLPKSEKLQCVIESLFI